MRHDLDYNHIQALKWLNDHSEPLNAQFFANNLSVSSKTVRSYLKYLDKVIRNYGAQISSKSGVGYHLVISDVQMFTKFCEELTNEHDQKRIFSNEFERTHFIVRYLLSECDIVKIDDIEQQLFVNRTTVNASLKKAKEVFDQFSLKIINQSKRGLKVVGDEHNIRACINYEFEFYCSMTINTKEEEKYTSFYKADSHILNALKNIIIKNQNAYTSNNLSDQSVDIIARAIYIAFIRNKLNNKLEFNINVRKRFSARNSYYLAKIILDRASRILDCEFTIDDIIEITIYIVGYRVLLDFQNITYSDDYLKTRDLAFDVIKYLEKINDFQYIGKDIRLADDISLQLVQILIRNEFKLQTSNYLQQRKCSLMADKLAVQVSYYLQIKLNVRLAKDDVYQLAMLIYPIFGRYPFRINKVKALLVSDINKSVAKGIVERLIRNFSSLILSIDMFEYYELKNIDFNEYQVLFTSLRSDDFAFLGNRLKIIYLNLFFDENDKIYIRQQLCSILINGGFNYQAFFNTDNIRYGLNFRTKKQALQDIVETIVSKEKITTDLLGDLLLTEDIYPAEAFENTVFISPVFPHTPKASLYVFVLQKLVNYNDRRVQIIIFWDRGLDQKQAINFENESVPHIIYLMFSDRHVINTLLNRDDPTKLMRVYRRVNDLVLANGKSFK